MPRRTPGTYRKNREISGEIISGLIRKLKQILGKLSGWDSSVIPEEIQKYFLQEFPGMPKGTLERFFN